MCKNENEGNFDFWHQEDRRYLGIKIQFEIVSEYSLNNIVDLGCGKANFTHTLKKKNNRVLGVDISETCINMARSKYPDLDFLSATADHFFETNKEHFDLVITSEILSYLENWEDIIIIFAQSSRFILWHYFSLKTRLGL